MIFGPVAGRGRPTLLVAELKLAAVGSLDLCREELVPERCVTDYVARRHVTRLANMSRWDRRASPFASVRGGRNVLLGDDVKVWHRRDHCGDATAPLPAPARMRSARVTRV